METVTGPVVGGRYRLLEPIGNGGTAVVWRAYDPVLNRRVAVKVLDEAVASNPDVVRRLRHEAQAVAQLNHPHVTQIYDFGVEEAVGGTARPYVVMELVSGPTLRQVLAGGGCLTWPQAAGVIGQVASALAAAHQRGIVHRDITPSNVMLGPDGVKVLDFGIVGLLGEQDGTGNPNELLGTPAYVAPERLVAAQGVVGAPLDVYALGVLWYRTLAGHLPWAVATPGEILRAHIDDEPLPLPSGLGIPDDQLDLGRRCLAKDPRDRPTAAAIAEQLAGARLGPMVPDVGGTEPDSQLETATGLIAWVTQVQTPAAEDDRPTGRSRRPLVAAFAALLAAAAIVLGWFSLRPAQSVDALMPAIPSTTSTASLSPTPVAVSSPTLGSGSAPTTAAGPGAGTGQDTQPTSGSLNPAAPGPTATAGAPASPTANPATAVSGVGGKVWFSCDANTPVVVEVDPTPGFTRSDGHAGPGTVQIVLKSSKQRTEITLACVGGVPHGSVKEHGGP